MVWKEDFSVKSSSKMATVNGKTKQIKKIAEVHVMCDMTWIPPPRPALPLFPPPLSLRPQHYGIASS